MRSVIAVFTLVVTSWAPRVVRAQALTIPSLDWRTIETPHFSVHYPRPADAWTRDVVSRLEAVHDAVSALVGAAPAARVTVIVEDPNNLSNGFALPVLGHPVIFFWPTPPEPTSEIGDSRGWGELLAVHEYAHIAHLTRPSRNSTVRWLSHLVPVPLGPLALKSPRWISEGYATYIEGQITGSGRPHGAWRAAILRQWALEGQLPTYGQLDGDGRFDGRAMAYLAGSAFIEWLVAHQGDSSLVHLWRRMSARRDRTFAEAFAGVFGGLPDVLYGRFTAELTGEALALEHVTRASAGAVRADSGAGRTVQSLTWETGSPSVSRDGSHLAIELTRRDGPSRIVVWSTAEPSEAAARRAQERLLEQDPEDVPAIAWRPTPRPALATLTPHGGVPYRRPRFFADGVHVLVVRATSAGDGAARGDLFVWNVRTGHIRRVTRDAGIRTGDPSPDGRWAVADRCASGICDVVRVDLGTGVVTRIAAGAPDVVYSRPRVSPDGRHIAVAVQRDGRWRVVVLDASSGSPEREVGPDDDVNRYDPAYLAGDTTLVMTAEAGGVPNIEDVDLTNGAVRQLTSVTGAAFAPEPDRAHGVVYFLRLHARGLDLAAVDDGAPGLPPLALPALTPAAPPPRVRGESLAASPIPASRGYGAGPRRYVLLPSISGTAEGTAVGLAIASVDPVGRLTWLAQGMYGARGTWRGASAGAAWRGWPATVRATAFFAEETPSRQHGGLAGPPALDVRYRGADVGTSVVRDQLTNAWSAALDVSAGTIDGAAYAHGGRTLAAAGLSWSTRQTPGDWRLTERAMLVGSAGRTADTGWVRGTAALAITLANGARALDARAWAGTTGAGAPAYEQFVLGGSASPLVAPVLLPQRIAMPVLPLAVAAGRSFAAYRVGLSAAPLEPYFWSASAGANLRSWHDVVGLEWRFAADGLWAVRLPSIRVLAGVGYSLSAPVRHRTAFYITATYHP